MSEEILRYERERAKLEAAHAYDRRDERDACGVGLEECPRLVGRSELDDHGQRELGGARGQPQRRTDQAREVRWRVGFVESEHDLEGQLRTRVEGSLERDRLARLRLADLAVNRARERDEGLRRAGLHAQREGLGQVTDDPGQLGALAIGEGRAHADVIRARVALQQGHERGQQQREGAERLATRERTQRADRRSEIDDALVTASRMASILAREPGLARQLERRRRHGQLLAHARACSLAGFGVEPRTQPFRVVGELQRRLGQIGRATARERSVGVRELGREHAHAPTIGGRVVEREHERVIVRVDVEQPSPQRQVVREIEGTLDDLAAAGEQRSLAQLGLARVAGQRLELEARASGVVHELLELAGGIAQAGAQRFVAGTQPLDRGRERIDVEPAPHTHGQRDRVAGVVGRELLP